MTSIITSLLTSSSSILSARIESLRATESSLISFSKLFNGSDTVRIEILDTPIPSTFYPRRARTGTCPIFSSAPAPPPDEFTIHSVRVTDSDPAAELSSSEKTPLVLLHGYSNSCLYFYRNLHGLSRHFRTLYALDLLGWGLSSRPPFPTSSSSEGGESSSSSDATAAAEDFFVESLEAWRKERNIPKMILGGHSMGGYLSVCYTERYPERVEKLILISPVGVPDRNKTVDKTRDYPLRFRAIFATLRLFWGMGYTPASLLRSLTEERGRSMVGGYYTKRLPAIDTREEREVLTEYLYANAVLPGSGEYCLNAILEPGAYARSPLVYRIPKLRVRQVDFIYGSMDWMDPSHAYKVKEICGGDGGSEDAPDVEVYQVDNAGHLLMLENWKGFNNAMILADNRRASLKTKE